MQVPAQCCLPKPLSPFLVNSSHSLSSIWYKSFSPQLCDLKIKARQWRKQQAFPVFASAENSAERWLLEPIGDGDTRHIGFKVARPGAYEIASSVVTVGRLPDKADLVIPVATVSGVHARIEKKEGGVLVTDLESTNGTFIDEKKLYPGVAAPASPGSSITFGDTHLAIFRLSKLEDDKQSQDNTPAAAA